MIKNGGVNGTERIEEGHSVKEDHLFELPPPNNDRPLCHMNPTLNDVCRSLYVELSDPAFLGKVW